MNWEKIGNGLSSAAKWLGRNHAFVAWAFVVVTSILATYFGVRVPALPVVPPMPVIVDGTQPEGANFGWVQDADAVKAVARTLPVQNFARTKVWRDAPASAPKDVYLWKQYLKVTGKLPPAKNQGSVGSCVAFGTNNAVERSLVVEIAVKNTLESFKFCCEEATYGGSRVQIGHGQIRGDGSVGAWAAQFVNKWGVVAHEVHGGSDLSGYSEARCREWGAKGVPEAVLALAKTHPVKEITQVENWAQAKVALANGYGIAVCSSQGFSMRRDSRGVAKASGSWGHCMCLDGYHAEGNAEFGHFENSWGADAHTGPVGWGEPSTAGFWADSKTIDKMLKAGDSWAFSAVEGWEPKKVPIDWFAINQLREKPLDRGREWWGEPLFAMAP